MESCWILICHRPPMGSLVVLFSGSELWCSWEKSLLAWVCIWDSVSQCFTAYSILQNYFWICPWFFWWKAVDYRIREQFIFVSKWPWGLPKRISFSRNLVLDLGQAYCGLNRFWIATHSTSFSCSLPGMLKVKCIEILLFLYLWYFLLQD